MESLNSGINEGEGGMNEEGHQYLVHCNCVWNVGVGA